MKITISNIPGDFPSGYSEQIYLDTRSVRIGRDFTIFETADAVKILNDQKYRKRKIQSINYDKYTIELITTESVDIDRINMANTVTIVQDSGDIHEAEIIDFTEATRMQNSEFRLYNLIYRNLTNKQTIDYLSNETVIVSGSERAYFEYENYDTSTTIRIKTFINSLFDVALYEFTENNDNFLKLRSSEYTFDTVEFLAYVTESEKNGILKYTNFTNLSTLKIVDDSTTYTAIEVPEIEIEDSELEGLYPVRIRLRYNQILKYPYAS